MATLLYDTFTGANGTALTSHTMDVGGGWTAAVGTFQIQSNKATPNSNADDDQVVADAGKADVDISVEIVPQGVLGVNLSNPAIILRWTDSSNFWLIDTVINGGSPHTLTLYEKAAGVYASKAFADPSIVAGSGYTVRATLSGQTIQIRLNEVLLITYTAASSNLTSTKFGLRLGKSGSPTSCTWDLFTVADLPQAVMTLAEPSLPNWGAAWLKNLPFTPMPLQEPAGTPVVAPTAQVLTGERRPDFLPMRVLGLSRPPVTPMPIQAPPSLSSVDLQKYPPPARLRFGQTRLIGLTGVPALPAPPNNPPAPPARQVLPPPVKLRFGPTRLLGLTGPPVTVLPAGPAVAPTPPGPVTSRARPFLPRVPTMRPKTGEDDTPGVSRSDERRLARHTELSSSFFNSATGKGQIQQTGPTDWKIIGGGFEAARPPGADDDTSIGATPGCTWVDTTGGQAYVCISNATGSAVWQEVGGSGGGGGGLTGTFP